jgi:hypothetical protein
VAGTEEDAMTKRERLWLERQQWLELGVEALREKFALGERLAEQLTWEE